LLQCVFARTVTHFGHAVAVCGEFPVKFFDFVVDGGDAGVGLEYVSWGNKGGRTLDIASLRVGRGALAFWEPNIRFMARGCPLSVRSVGLVWQPDRILSGSCEKDPIFFGEEFSWRASAPLLKQAPRMGPRKTKTEAGTKDFDDISDEMIEYLLQRAEANLSSTSSMEIQPVPRLKYFWPTPSLIIGQFLGYRRTSLLKETL
jgi:hypothetical protein